MEKNVRVSNRAVACGEERREKRELVGEKRREKYEYKPVNEKKNKLAFASKKAGSFPKLAF